MGQTLADVRLSRTVNPYPTLYKGKTKMLTPPQDHEKRMARRKHLEEKAKTKNREVKTDGSLNDMATLGKRIQMSPPTKNRSKGGEKKRVLQKVSNEYSEALMEQINQYFFLLPAQDVEELIHRIEFYITDCMNRSIPPTVEGFAFAVGVSRNTFMRWAKRGGGHDDNSKYGIARRCVEYIQWHDASAAASNKINPVIYIFRAKNFYDMRDQQDINVSHDPLESNKSADELIDAIDADVVDVD